ncbi:platelet-activating factor acetylhydrolase-like [Glandiceps talaboti]
MATNARLPEGRGPYTVGCMDVMTGKQITDGSFFRLFYPSSVKSLKESNQSIPGIPWFPREEYTDFYRISPETQYATDDYYVKVTQEDKDKLRSCVVPVVDNGQVLAIEDKPTFPIIIYSHGLGSSRFQYSALCVDLVSQGFIVAAVEHRDNSAGTTYLLKENDTGTLAEEWVHFILSKPSKDEFALRNQQVKKRALECSRVLDVLEGLNNGDDIDNVLDRNSNLEQFKGRLDNKRVAVVGHSFGGGTTIQTLYQDQRFRCAIGLDSWIFPLDVKSIAKSIQQPFLLINDERFQWAGNIVRMNRLLLRDAPSQRKLITIMGTDHDNQTDLPLILDYWKDQHRIDPLVAMGIQNDAIIAFMSRHTGLEYNTSMDLILKGQNPHVIEGTNIRLAPKKAKL